MKLARITGRIDRRSPPSVGDMDRALVVVAMLDSNLDGVLEMPRQPIGPLDGGDAIAACQLVEAEVVHLDRFQSVKIDVVERQPSAAIFLDERESGAGDLARLDPQPGGEAADKRGLPCSEISRQQHHVARPDTIGEIAAGGGGFCFRAGGNGHPLFSTTFRRAVSSMTASPRCAARSPAVIATSPSSASARSPAMPCR